MRLLLAGDVTLGRRVNQALRAWPPESPWRDTLSLFRQADWSFCNLECVISDHAPSRLPDKAFHFRSDRKNVANAGRGPGRQHDPEADAPPMREARNPHDHQRIERHGQIQSSLAKVSHD